MWKVRYIDLSAPLGPGNGYNATAISDQDALLLATQLRSLWISVSGRMTVDLPGRWSGTLNLGTAIDTRTGSGIYGISQYTVVGQEGWFAKNATITPGPGSPAYSALWSPRPDPADRVLCGYYTPVWLADFSFPWHDWTGENPAINRYSELRLELAYNAGWFLSMKFIFAQNPPPIAASPPFYLCNPNNPGVYPLRATGNVNIMGYTLPWQARSPVSAGSDVWGPAVDCRIDIVPTFE